MEKAFQIESLEKQNSNKYKIGGRALCDINIKTQLTNIDREALIDVENIIYFGKELEAIEAMFTCYLILKSSVSLKDDESVLYKL